MKCNIKREVLRIRCGKCREKKVQVIHDLFLEAIEGELVGIMCGSWDDKACLVRLLSGETGFTEGEIIFREENLGRRWMRPISLPQNRIAIIRAESRLMPSISLIENLLIRDTKLFRFFLPRHDMYCRARELLEQFQVEINLRQPVHTLNRLQRVQVELLKAYVGRQDVILLDDLSRFLSEEEIRLLMGLVEQLKEYGVTFFWLGTRDAGIAQYADRTFVLMHGRTLRSFRRRAMDGNAICRLMDCIVQTEADSERLPPAGQTCVFSCHDICGQYLRGADFHAFSGEFLQVVYDDRDSMMELLQIIMGERRPQSGRMSLSGRDYLPLSYEDAVHKKVCLVQPDAMETQLCYHMSIFDNICMARAGKLHGIWLHPQYRRNIAAFVAQDIDLDAGQLLDAEIPAHVLQTILYDKWLLYAPKLLVILNPLTSVDARMQEVALKMLKRFLRRGVSVLMLTNEHKELADFPMRTLWLHYGRLEKR